ncbi:MAG: serine/threonine protein kinase, partial [Massilia sp.]
MSAALDFDLFVQLHSSRRSRVARAPGVDGAAVIVKQPNQEFPSFQENARFRREFEIARRCAHPAVVAPLTLAEAGGRWTITFADIGGVSLDKLLRQRALTPAEFFGIALQLCDAVAAVHAQGVVHKDINPSNLVWNASTGQLQLIDFGIASELPQEAQALVHPAALEGTLAYMAPEQTGRMNRLLDYRADLYAVGATLFDLLAGRPPFVVDDAMELIHCHIAREPDWDLPALQALPAGLASILRRLLDKDAERRYQGVAALAADLAAVRDARPPQATSLAGRTARWGARFIMPPALVGRDREVGMLMAAFERAAAGGTELLLVGGYSGIGKSAVVNEVHKPITARRAIFLAGKFDQFRRDVPYASLLEALRTLVRQLLAEPEAQLAEHRRRLRAALGAGLAVMVELLPELALVVGPVPAPAPLPPEQAQARLARVLPALIDVFAAPGRPLVLFLDDLQWADAPTLRMLEVLVRRGAEGGSGKLLLLGAYRDNETPPTHPLTAMRERLLR